MEMNNFVVGVQHSSLEYYAMSSARWEGKRDLAQKAGEK